MLPRWFDDDGLMLQRVTGKPNWEEIQIDSPRSQRIAAMVRSDWQKVAGGQQS